MALVGLRCAMKICPHLSFLRFVEPKKKTMNANNTHLKKAIWLKLLPNVIFMLFILGCKSGENSDIIPANYIIEDLSKNTNVILKGKTIKDKLNFVSVNSQKILGCVYIEPAVCFVNCTFEDSVYAFADNYKCVFDRKVVFKDCIFKKGVCFQNAEFRDEVFMDLSKIEGVTSFSGAVFRSKVSFDGTNFSNNAFFQSAVFFMESSFYKSFFKKDCIFHFARFNNIAKFSESYFYGYTDFSQIFSSSFLDFSECKFSGETSMSYSTLLGDVLFANCRFGRKARFEKNAVLGEINLRNIAGEKPDIADNKMFNN